VGNGPKLPEKQISIYKTKMAAVCYGTVKPPNSGQPWARKKCPLLGGARYWEKGHIFAVERQKKTTFSDVSA